MNRIIKISILFGLLTSFDAHCKTVRFVIECWVADSERDGSKFELGNGYVTVNGRGIDFNRRVQTSDTVSSIEGFTDSRYFVTGKNRIHFSGRISGGAATFDTRIFRAYMEKVSSGQKKLVEIVKLVLHPGDKNFSGRETIDIDSCDLDPEVRAELLEREKHEERQGQKSALEELAASVEKMFGELEAFRKDKQRAIDKLLCFPAGTQVFIDFNGESNPIEDLCQGDIVCSYDLSEQKYCYAPVAKTYQNPSFDMVSIELASGDSIVSTSSHLFYDDQEQSWVEAQELGPDSVLLGFNDEKISVVEVNHLDLAASEDVYSIAVSGTENFFVGDGGVLVHNCTPGAAEKIEQAIAYGLLIYPGTGIVTRLTKVALRLVRLLGQDNPIVQSAKEILKNTKDSAKKSGFNLKTLSSSKKTDQVLMETLSGKGNLTSKFILKADEALESGIKWVGDGYKEIGRMGSGVYRSKDGLRQFRMDKNSISGNHAPNKPHVHFETYQSGAKKFEANNHVPFMD